MPLLDPSRPSGPIPGENFTSDERNYPWHRPPDITNVDEAIDYVSKVITTTEDGFQYMAFLESGITVAAVTDMILTIGIADGKWSIDFAILIAGPVARMVTIMAKSYGIEYEMGTEMPKEFVSSEVIKAFAGGQENAQGAVADEIEDIKATAPQEDGGGGLMSMAPEDEQNAMLGYGTDDDVEPDMEEDEV